MLKKGSPVSPNVCKLYMEDFERRVMESALYPQRCWKRNVDDTDTVFLKAQEFTDHRSL